MPVSESIDDRSRTCVFEIFKSVSNISLFKGLRSDMLHPEIFRCASLFNSDIALSCLTLVYDRSSSLNSRMFERISMFLMPVFEQLNSFIALKYLNDSSELTGVPEQLNTSSLFRFLIGDKSSIKVFEISISTNSESSLMGERSLRIKLFDISIFLIFLNVFKKLQIVDVLTSIVSGIISITVSYTISKLSPANKGGSVVVSSNKNVVSEDTVTTHFIVTIELSENQIIF